MIVFLNFAPIEFMGGAEKWVLDTARKLKRKENVEIISVAPNLANIYGQFALQRTFLPRISHISYPNYKIGKKSLIPFSQQWRTIHRSLTNARIIYAKYEFLEILLILYFSGLQGLKKTVVGIHSPLQYSQPKSLLQKLHNVLYISFISKVLFSAVKRVHVLTIRDKTLVKEKFNIAHTTHVPNTIEINQTELISSPSSRLKVLFIGELSERKGVDIILDMISMITKNISLTIVGDGPLQSGVKYVSHNKKNITYLGYLNHDLLHKIYQEHDVLLLPSRAESMPLTLLEALAHGLTIVDAKNISLGLPQDIEYPIESYESYPYFKILYQLSQKKEKEGFNKKKVYSYFKNTFSAVKIDQALFTQVFN